MRKKRTFPSAWESSLRLNFDMRGARGSSARSDENEECTLFSLGTGKKITHFENYKIRVLTFDHAGSVPADAHCALSEVLWHAVTGVRAPTPRQRRRSRRSSRHNGDADADADVDVDADAAADTDTGTDTGTLLHMLAMQLTSIWLSPVLVGGVASVRG